MTPNVLVSRVPSAARRLPKGLDIFFLRFPLHFIRILYGLAPPLKLSAGKARSDVARGALRGERCSAKSRRHRRRDLAHRRSIRDDKELPEDDVARAE